MAKIGGKGMGIMVAVILLAGIGAPAISRNVSGKSRFITSLSLTLPGLVLPGQRTKSGVRNDSSYIHRLSYQPCSPRY